MRALLWLKAHHPDYQDITISDENLATLPEDGDVSGDMVAIEQPVDDDQIAPPPGVDGEDPRSPTDAMVPNSALTRTEVELLKDSVSKVRFTRRNLLPRAPVPDVQCTPLDELGKTVRLFAMVFPTLFPTGEGDWHEGRKRDIPRYQWARHFLRHRDRRYGTHPRFRFMAFSLLMRQKSQSASSFFVTSHPDFQGLDTTELIEKLNETENFLHNVVRGGSKLTGTRPY